MEKNIHNTQDENAPDSYVKQENKNGTNEQIVMTEEKKLKDDTDTKERVHRENLKNKMKSREMMIKAPQKLDCNQLLIDNKDNLSEFRQLPSSFDKERMSLVLHSKDKEHKNDKLNLVNLVRYLQNASNSSTSGSSEIEDCRMFLLFPVYEVRALKRKECRERVSCSLSRRVFPNGPNESCKKECDKLVASLRTVPKHSSSCSLSMKPSLFDKSQEIGRVRKENLKNKMKDRGIMNEGPQKHEAVLDSLQQVIDNKDNTSEFRELEPFLDIERVPLLQPSESSKKHYDDLVAFLKNSSTSSSLEIEPVFFRKKQEKLSALVSYLEKPKFRVRINVVTSAMFESAMREIRASSVEEVYRLVYVKEKRANIFTCEMLRAALNTVCNETARRRIDKVQYENPKFRREN